MQLKNIIIAITATALYGCSEHKPAETKATADAPPHYQLVTVQKAGMEQTVKLPAQLAAYEEVSIFPKVNGYVKSVLVDIGSHVSKGQLLMTLEAPEVQQAVLQAKEKYARAKADYTLNKENYYRLKVAAKTAGAIAPMDLATAKSRMEADSALANSEKANWQIQQSLMDYLHVTAPFDGIITERNTHPGALVSAEAKDKPLLELKQVSHLRLQVDIPEGLSVTLKDKDAVNFYLSALPGRKMTANVSRKAGNVNIQYRSERVELDVPNKNGSLSPGMYADVILQSKASSNALIVPKSAVVTSTERKYVIAIRNGKTVKVDVSTGIENANKIEIIGDLKSGEQVIAIATEEIEDGLAVK
ncbi:efflux RND transporter periplasmic adaptor subunit [Mucilaginibacter jinjuensis]|uniref:Efflux RND transporter periplasmic adaptor subunit n=1 Tax=Mucilaginibacter jinjuensis TaxID=1176721 RepID=A0ABY7TGQ4_9SPHI|nr:efflux RND transporter periplasmic adaptor subunit [Mucilaginibacter jinjuensis]WCT14347.1 efflux RND transporter periplasmic adaptor subunit [Mucilaginibacter jinjuensis]